MKSLYNQDTNIAELYYIRSNEHQQ